MIIEQIRYFLDEQGREELLAARREISAIRESAGIPGGRILIADGDVEGTPYLLWQCGYGDEAEMGMAETALIGNPTYEAARDRVGALAVRVELELYIADDGTDLGARV
jgi:hypothetical protein